MSIKQKEIPKAPLTAIQEETPLAEIQSKTLNNPKKQLSYPSKNLVKNAFTALRDEIATELEGGFILRLEMLEPNYCIEGNLLLINAMPLDDRRELRSYVLGNLERNNAPRSGPTANKFFEGAPKQMENILRSLFVNLVSQEGFYNWLITKGKAGETAKVELLARRFDLLNLFETGKLTQKGKNLRLIERHCLGSLSLESFTKEPAPNSLTVKNSIPPHQPIQPNMGFNPFPMQNVFQQQIFSMPTTSNQLKTETEPVSIAEQVGVSPSSQKIQKVSRPTQAAFQNGQKAEKRKIALNLLELKVSLKKIIKATGLTEVQLQKLKNKQPEAKVEDEF